MGRPVPLVQSVEYTGGLYGSPQYAQRTPAARLDEAC